MKTIYKSILSLTTLLACSFMPAWGEDYETFSKFEATADDGGFASYYENYEKLVDGDKSTKWCRTNFSSAYIEFQHSGFLSVYGYVLTTGNDTGSNPQRNPKSWRLRGKKRPSDEWVTIDSIANDAVLEAASTTSYTFMLEEPTDAYKYFRFEVSKVDYGSVMQLSELELLAKEVACTHQPVHHEKIAARCLVNGRMDYWTCSVCEKDFKDEACTEELESLDELTIPALNATTITVGDIENCESSDELGFCSFYCNGGSQAMYKTDEISACTISSIALCCMSSGELSRYTKVYIMETDQEYLYSPIEGTDSDLYFEDSLLLGQNSGAWEEIVLDRPFVYSGQKNLVIGIYSSSNGYKQISYACEEKAGLAIYRESDGSSIYADIRYQGAYDDGYRPIIRFMSGNHTFDPDEESHDGFAVCSVCGEKSAPATLGTVALQDGIDYVRTAPCTVTGSLTYVRNFATAREWEPFYVPFSLQYTQAEAGQYDLCEIHTYSVAEDTDGDGYISSKDQKCIILNKVALGKETLPNTPYLIRPKRAGEFIFNSCDNVLHAAEVNSVDCGSLRETFTFTGNNEEMTEMASENCYIISGDQLVKVTDDETSLQGLRWYMTTDSESDAIPFYLAPSEFELADGDVYAEVKDFTYPRATYTRNFVSTQWQSLYVPFSISVETLASYGLTVAELNDTHMYDRDEDGEPDETELEFFVLKRGSTVANYPYMIKPAAVGTVTIPMTSVLFKAATETSIECSTFKQKFTITGTYTGVSGTEMFANQYYAPSGTGLSKAASDAVSLKPQRWYLQVTNKADGSIASLAPQMRIRIDGEWIDEIETGISGVTTLHQEQITYDLDGRKVNASERKSGLYLQNGKKFFVK